MAENAASGINTLLGDDLKSYLDSHPEVADQFRRAEKIYATFGDYIRLTQQPRIVLREVGGSNTEADLSAALSQANR